MRKDNIPVGKRLIEADSETHEITLVDHARNTLTISSDEGLENFISYLTRITTRNGQVYEYEHQKSNPLDRSYGTFQIIDHKVEELIRFLREAEDIVKPRHYEKLF